MKGYINLNLIESIEVKMEGAWVVSFVGSKRTIDVSVKGLKEANAMLRRVRVAKVLGQGLLRINGAVKHFNNAEPEKRAAKNRRYGQKKNERPLSRTERQYVNE